jgi:glucose/arabinose dehydrogenase
MNLRASHALAACALLAAAWPAAGAVPAGFQTQTVTSGFSKCVGLDIAADGRIFVVEQRGIVWVVQNGAKSMFLDLRSEVGFGADRGLLSVALDPGFVDNRHVYLLYTVDPIPGDPDEPPETETFGRLTRYTGTPESGGNVADPASRLVIIGQDPSMGLPACHSSHHIGSIRFGTDGSLFVSAGDGAHFDFADDGGADPTCFQPPLFSPDQDLGAFRSQYLATLAGKILRIDPLTGDGLPDNPYFTGDPAGIQSKIWAYGLRNPFRFTIRPDTESPGTIYVGDVGWFTFEEMNVCRGGENFGWPCFESPAPAPEYPALDPASNGCETIGGRENPAPHTPPIVWWHHGASGQSFPLGYSGSCAVCGVFYPGGKYPTKFHGAMFFSDFISNWVRVLRVDEQDEFIAMESFATLIGGAVGFAIHPVNGDIHYVTTTGVLRRLKYTGIDLTGEGAVNGDDLGVLLANWGQPGIGDLNEDGVVNGADLGLLLTAWTG